MMEPEGRDPTVGAVLRSAVAALGDAGIDGAVGDARHLVAAALGIGRDRLTLHIGDRMTAAQVIALKDMLVQRRARRPVSRILGRRAFFGHEFTITDSVLDPRPDTETLVEQALGGPITRVLDLGTGSGCILLSLLAARPDLQGVGTDISADALAVARRNAATFGLGDRAEFRVSDWFAQVDGVFDLIVSNPPYIAADEVPGLAAEVRLHDPLGAISDGADGLGAYRAILVGADAHLSRGGRLMVEIGSTQADAVQALFHAADLIDVALIHDIDARPRVVAAMKRP